MTKTEVLAKMDNEPWSDNACEGSIKSVWGFNKTEAVTIHRVHYTIDPYFKVPCGDTEPTLTLCLPRIVPMVDLDKINYEDYKWLTTSEIEATGKKVTDLMAEL